MSKIRNILLCLAAIGLMIPACVLAGEPPLKALIVDGRMNKYHNWKGTSPVLEKILKETTLFSVDFATPAGDGPVADFKPDFSKYDVVVLNYDTFPWPDETKKAFVEYVSGGGGVVVFHSADNAFADWKEFNEIIGLGGWGGRNDSAGPMVHWLDGKMALDNSPGGCGDHGPQHEYQMVHRSPEHPILAGLPTKWMHTKDELYSKMRGPAKNLTLLATAYSDPEKPNGTGKHEPLLFTIDYGKGRVFHTMLGHDAEQLRSVGFIVTFQRGAEWAASGKVTQKRVPEDFPTATKSSAR